MKPTPAAALAAAPATPRARGKAAGARARPASKAQPAWPEGASAAAVPVQFAPELATLVSSAPAEGDWSYEVKYDGYRILAHVDGGHVRLLTRNGNDWTAKLPGIAAELGKLRLESGWIDGEIVVFNDAGASDFGALQNAFESGASAIRYIAFDLPWCDGQDLRACRLEDRRSQLERLLGGAGDTVRFSTAFQAEATDILRNACRMRLEGVIGKRLGSPYVSRRSPDWIKLKCTLRQEFVVGGYTEPQGSRTGLGALLLGIHDEQGQLRFAGSVGTGFDVKTLGAVRRKLSALEAAATPFFEKPREARGTWVEPKLVAEVSFTEWTRDGKVRHAVFHGLREDKPATAIRRERPAAEPGSTAAAGTASRTRGAAAVGKPAAARPVAAAPGGAAAAPMASAAAAPRPMPATPDAGTGTQAATPAASAAAADGAAAPAPVRITHPERVIDPSTGLTKRDLIDYYLHAARRLLPHLARRPVALVRAPAGVEGQQFFQKHSGSLRIEGLRQLPEALDPGHPALIEIDTFVALISAAQMNVVEFHTWNATSARLEKPDRITFDLDPGEGVQWPQMVEAAELTRSVLEGLGLRAFLKTSGGKGVHVVVPLQPREGWDPVKDFSRDVVERLAALAPEKLVAKSGAKNRVGKIFVDYLRNGRGATTVAAFSARARPGLGVSMPCAWEELEGLGSGARWTIANAHERLESADDPWADCAAVRQTLTAARKALARA